MARSRRGVARVALQARIPQWLYDLICKLAEEEDRSVNGEIVYLTKQALRDLEHQRTEALATEDENPATPTAGP